MGIITVSTITSPTQNITQTVLNNLVANLVTEFNGNIDNDNIDASAAIADTKLAQITTANKVSGSAIVAVTGTWTPVDPNGAISFTSAVGSYYKLGKLVLAQYKVVFPSSSDTSDAGITMPLKITCSDTVGYPSGVCVCSNAYGVVLLATTNDSVNAGLYATGTSTRSKISELSGQTIWGSLFYYTTE